jgi:hypothetical protein
MLETQTVVMKVVGLDDRSAVSKVAMSAAERVTSLAARLAVVWVVTRVGPMDMMTVVELVAWTAAKMDDLSVYLMAGKLDKRSVVCSVVQMVTRKADRWVGRMVVESAVV